MIDEAQCFCIQERIWVQDLSEIEWEETDKVYYDASPDLEEEEEPQEAKQKPPKLRLQNGEEITMARLLGNETPKFPKEEKTSEK